MHLTENECKSVYVKQFVLIEFTPVTTQYSQPYDGKEKYSKKCINYGSHIIIIIVLTVCQRRIPVFRVFQIMLDNRCLLPHKPEVIITGLLGFNLLHLLPPPR